MVLALPDSPTDGAPGSERAAEDQRRQRRRSIAIALMLVAVVVIFYAVTIIRLGGNIAQRAL